MDSKDLIKLAQKAMANSYSPYSKVKIGACVLAGSGKTYMGTNIENASFGATICGERSAISAAISAGEKTILAVAIKGSIDDIPWPCGICRQVMSEFGQGDMKIYLGQKDGSIIEYTLDQLLPNRFGNEWNQEE